MNNEMKTPEEKAREYTDDVIGNYHYVGWDKEEATMELNNAYLVSYHSRDEEVKELREALKELVALSEAESKDDIIQYEMDNNTELKLY